jgi:FAD dependent oxidoreductase
MATFTREVVIYGATFPGLIAARKLAAMGHTVYVLEWTSHIGGLTTGGLGKGDVVTGTRWGLTEDFFKRIGANPPYNLVDTEVVNFSPSEAILAMNQMLLDDTTNVTVVTSARLKRVTMDGTQILNVVLENGDVYAGTIFLDCSYEGDLAAMAGCTMSYGRDSWGKYRERIEYNAVPDASKPGFNLDGADLDAFKSVDAAGNLYPWRTWPPYDRPEASPSSRSQAYGWRFSVDKRVGRLAWPQPAGYRAADFAWVGDMIANNGGAGSTFPIRLSAFEVSGTGSNKFTCNGGDLPGFFTNPWTKASYAERIAIQNKAFWFTAGILYFAANDASVSSTYRNNLNLWGLPSDEFQTDFIGAPGWPSAFYVRQSRYLVGQYVMTTNDAFDDGGGSNWHQPDSIGVGGYVIDAHPYYWYPKPNGTETVEEGKLDYAGLKRYDIPLRAILPHKGQCSNLLVPVCASTSCLIMNSLRMEPTWGVMCESAGTLAGLALDRAQGVNDVPYSVLQARLVADGAILSI